MSDETDAGGLDLERARRFASWVAGCVCAVGFSGLLVLSGTTLWTPDNPLVALCDRVWKTAGLAFVILASIPWLGSAVRRVRSATSS